MGTINAQSVKADSIKAIGPAGTLPMNLVSYDPATGRGNFDLDRNWAWDDSGFYSIVTGDAGSAVTDDSSNRVIPAQLLGGFNVNIPQPADTTPPIATLISVNPTDITTPGQHKVTIVVEFSDPA